MTDLEWLDFYQQPTSVIFGREPDGWAALRRLIDARAIVATGNRDAGGHMLFQTACGARPPVWRTRVCTLPSGHAGNHEYQSRCGREKIAWGPVSLEIES